MSKKSLLWLAAAAGLGWAGRAAVRAARRLCLADKVVVLTGGSRGLGLVLARQLAAARARLVICARDADELERARVELVIRGAEVRALRCDVTERGQVEEMMQRVVDDLGGIDILINNAGVIEVVPAEVMTLADYEEALRTHFWGPLYTISAALPHLRRRPAGRIVNIASIGGKISVPHLVPYSVSKFALVALSEGLRAELLKDGIYVTTVIPGLMRTGSPRNATFKGQHRAEYAWFSISDSLPLVSISAEHAARRIIDACRHGDAACRTRPWALSGTECRYARRGPSPPPGHRRYHDRPRPRRGVRFGAVAVASDGADRGGGAPQQ
jgi:NAD(P)-dependent dehydrogenase (short-subunit alcohol dehydrogenase family)